MIINELYFHWFKSIEEKYTYQGTMTKDMKQLLSSDDYDEDNDYDYLVKEFYLEDFLNNCVIYPNKNERIIVSYLVNDSANMKGKYFPQNKDGYEQAKYLLKTNFEEVCRIIYEYGYGSILNLIEIDQYFIDTRFTKITKFDKDFKYIHIDEKESSIGLNMLSEPNNGDILNKYNGFYFEDTFYSLNGSAKFIEENKEIIIEAKEYMENINE
jgi:hypothetical protein